MILNYPLSVLKRYTISYNTDGSTSTPDFIEKKTKNKPYLITSIEPEKTKNKFKYWVDSAENLYTKDNILPAEFNENLNLKAFYNNIWYVTYDSNGGTPATYPTDEVEDGSSLKIVNKPTPPETDPESVFNCWKDADNNSYYIDTTYTISTDLELTAEYTQNITWYIYQAKYYFIQKNNEKSENVHFKKEDGEYIIFYAGSTKSFNKTNGYYTIGDLLRIKPALWTMDMLKKLLYTRGLTAFTSDTSSNIIYSIDFNNSLANLGEDEDGIYAVAFKYYSELVREVDKDKYTTKVASPTAYTEGWHEDNTYWSKTKLT